MRKESVGPSRVYGDSRTLKAFKPWMYRVHMDTRCYEPSTASSSSGTQGMLSNVCSDIFRLSLMSNRKEAEPGDLLQTEQSCGSSTKQNSDLLLALKKIPTQITFFLLWDTRS